MKKYKNPYEMPYNITHDSNYYFNAFRREIMRGEGAVSEERKKIALASMNIFHHYIEEKEQAFKTMNNKLEKNQGIEL